jgi:hypothetical protein
MKPSWGECYLDHYEHYLKAPSGNRTFNLVERAGTLQIFSYERIFDGCLVFSSFGLSRFGDTLGAVAEVVVPVDAGWDVVPEAIAGALGLMIERGMKPQRGLSLGGIDLVVPTFATRFGKVALYLTRLYGLPEEFGLVRCGAAVGSVYLGMFLSQAENLYFIQHGADAFENAFQAFHVDPFHLERPSSI